MTRFGLGLVHSPAGPGPIIQVQVHPYLDLDLDIWGPDLGPPGPGLDFGQSNKGSSNIEVERCELELELSSWRRF